MKLNSEWRILTVGDGDLSFSASLLQLVSPCQLTASVLDDEALLLDKYAANGLQALMQSAATVHTGIDIQNPSTWRAALGKIYDLVIFQFPLITADASATAFRGDECASTNILNRRLLFDFLRHCQDDWLAADGAGLCYITSKDVKPYLDWRIDALSDPLAEMNFMGTLPFDVKRFPGYRIRNVDRDLDVRDTAATTYVWQHACAKNSAASIGLDLEQPLRCSENHCPLCGHGPFARELDRKRHEHSRRHQQMQQFEDAWQVYLARREYMQ